MSSDKCLNMLDIPLISLVYEHDAESVNLSMFTPAPVPAGHSWAAQDAVSCAHARCGDWGGGRLGSS